MKVPKNSLVAHGQYNAWLHAEYRKLVQRFSSMTHAPAPGLRAFLDDLFSGDGDRSNIQAPETPTVAEEPGIFLISAVAAEHHRRPLKARHPAPAGEEPSTGSTVKHRP